MDALVAAGLSRAEMPEFFLELDDMPLMSNGKIKKSDLAARIRDGRVVPIAIGTASTR
jgi:hypothetical protein